MPRGNHFPGLRWRRNGLSNVKELLGKRLPYPAFQAAFQLVRERPRANARRKKIAELGLASWEEMDFLQYKSSDTLFILGSGPSINAIKQSRWASIMVHDSFGFNFWLCHDVVPTVYFFEGVHVNNGLYGSYDWRLSVLTRLTQLMAERANDYRAIPKIVDELHPEESHWHELLPDSFASNLYVANTLLMAGREKHDVARSLKRELRRGTFDLRGHLGSVPKFGYSLGTLLSIAVCLRYKRVVLCGIDINRPGYFYNDLEKYPQMAHFHSSPSHTTHYSHDSWGLRCAFKDYVLVFFSEVMAPIGIELYVESQESALYPNIPLAPASIFRQ
jgi:hypothetical protein